MTEKRTRWNSSLPAPTKPMKPGPGPKRRTPMRTRNPERWAQQRERNFGDWADVVRRMDCYFCGRAPGTCGNDPAHMDPRGMGGYGGDLRVILPACRADHRWIDEHPLVRHDYIAVALALYAAHHTETE